MLIDEPGEANDRIRLTRVAGVEWVVDRDRVRIPAGRAHVDVPLPRREYDVTADWVRSNEPGCSPKASAAPRCRHRAP